jgi:hypothetical protein
MIVCWKVESTGDILERDGLGLTGLLQKRNNPVLSTPMDTHEIVVDAGDRGTKVIPVVTLVSLWAQPVVKKPKTRGTKGS